MERREYNKVNPYVSTRIKNSERMTRNKGETRKSLSNFRQNVSAHQVAAGRSYANRTHFIGTVGEWH
jgi:hypothetical protein